MKRFEPENFLQGRSGCEVLDAGLLGDEEKSRGAISSGNSGSVGGNSKSRSGANKKSKTTHVIVSQQPQPQLPVAPSPPKKVLSRLKRGDIAMTHIAASQPPHTPSSSSSFSSDTRIRRITSVNFDAYLLFFMSHLPSLILTSEPAIPSSASSSSSDESCDISVGPYQTFIHATQLFSWCLDEVGELLCEGCSDELTKQIIPLASHTIRVCRTAIGATEYAILASMRWRNASSFPSSHASEGSGTGSGSQQAGHTHTETDWASVDYLGGIFVWSTFLLHRIHDYATKVTNTLMVKKHLLFPKGLSRSVPSLKTHVDKLLIKLERWKMENDSVALNVEASLLEADSDGDWAQSLQHHATQYNRLQYEIIAAPLPLSAWKTNDGAASHTASRHWKQPYSSEHGGAVMGQEKKSISTSTMMESSNGFGVSSSRRQSASGGGWGGDDSDSSGESDEEGDGKEEEEMRRMDSSHRQQGPALHQVSQQEVYEEEHSEDEFEDEDEEDEDGDDVLIDSDDSYDSDSELDELT